MKQQPTRRRFLGGAAAAAGSTLLLRSKPGEAHLFDHIPAPERSGIEHIVVVMMENRSFDHLLGWLPGARPTAPVVTACGSGFVRSSDDQWLQLRRSPLVGWRL